MRPLVVVAYLTHVRDLTDILQNKAHPDPLHGTNCLCLCGNFFCSETYLKLFGLRSFDGM